MKRVAVFGSIMQFEAFVNDPKVSIIDVKVNSCEQSYNFQDCFIGVVFYEDAPLKSAESPDTTGNIDYTAQLFDLVWKSFSSKVDDSYWKLFAKSWGELLNSVKAPNCA